MWVRKTAGELQRDKEERIRKTRQFLRPVIIAMLVALPVYLVLFRGPGPIELLIMMVFACVGFMVWYFAAPYIGSGYRTGMICLYCNRGIGYGNDGFGFKKFGPGKPKWYQFRACRTFNKCDIHYQSQVKWVEDRNRG